MTEHSQEPPAWSDDDMQMRILDGPPPEGFDCGSDAQNRFLYERAWKDQKVRASMTHLLFIKGMLAGYVTLLGDRIGLGPNEKPKGYTWHYVGCMKIGQLAVDKRFAGQGLGKDLIAYAVEYARTLLMGCRYVTLDAELQLVEWYEGLGFVRNKEEQGVRMQMARERHHSVDNLAISMRFDLREWQPDNLDAE